MNKYKTLARARTRAQSCSERNIIDFHISRAAIAHLMYVCVCVMLHRNAPCVSVGMCIFAYAMRRRRVHRHTHHAREAGRAVRGGVSCAEKMLLCST